MKSVIGPLKSAVTRDGYCDKQHENPDNFKARHAQRTELMIKFDSQSSKGFPRKLTLMEPRVTTLTSCIKILKSEESTMKSLAITSVVFEPDK